MSIPFKFILVFFIFYSILIAFLYWCEMNYHTLIRSWDYLYFFLSEDHIVQRLSTALQLINNP